MIITYNELKKELKNKSYHPIYFLFGAEPYYIDAISKYLSTSILPPGERDFNQSTFYGKEASVSTILDVAMKYPMLSQYNVVILKEAQEFKNMADLIPYFESPNPQTVFVICYKNKTLDKRTKLYKILQKSACIFESKTLYDNQVSGWIDKYVSQKKFRIDPKARFALQEFIGIELSKLSKEIDKLVQIKGENKYISLEDIENNIGISKEYNVFEIQNAVGQRNSDKTIRIINFIKSNPKALPIQSLTPTLFGFFSKLLVLAYAKNFDDTYRNLGLPPFYKKDYSTACKNYYGKLPLVIGILKEYDLRSKGIGDASTPSEELAREMLTQIISI